MKFEKEHMKYVLAFEKAPLGLLEPGANKKLEVKYEFYKKREDGKVWSRPIERGLGGGMWSNWPNSAFYKLEKADIDLEKLDEYMQYLIDREAFEEYNLKNIYFEYLSHILFFKDELTEDEKYPQNLLTKARIFEAKANDAQELKERCRV